MGKAELKLTYRNSLKPKWRPVTLSHPARIGRDPEPSAGQVDTEDTLGAVGGAVAITGLAVRNWLASNLSCKCEIMRCKIKSIVIS